jgi:pimeloyl-ACP methyl ester carboxylesterase
MTPTTKNILTPLLDITYLEYGNPSAFPVLLLHGWPDDVHTWDAIAPVLAQSGYRVIVPFLRGCGATRFRSPGTIRSGQLAALGQDVIDLADALGLDQFSMVGHDWGARAASIAAGELQAQNRVRHLVLMSVGYGTNHPAQILSFEQIHNYWYHWYMALPRGRDHLTRDRRAFTRYIWGIWAPNWRFTDDAFGETAQSFDNPDWAEIVIHSYSHRWGHADGDPQYAALEQRLNPVPVLTIPTLLLHGAGDPVNHPSMSADKEHLFDGRYVRKLLPDVGHFPQRETPTQVAGELLAWLGTE